MVAIRAGAADYPVKDEMSEPLLDRSIRYAIERKRTEGYPSAPHGRYSMR